VYTSITLNLQIATTTNATSPFSLLLV